MKNKPLALQIWLVIALLTIGICFLLWLTIPSMLGEFFSREMYKTIEAEQISRLGRVEGILDQDRQIERDQERQDIRSVTTFVLQENGRLVLPRIQRLPQRVVTEIRDEALGQTSESARYAKQIEDQRIFYVIRKITARSRTFYVVSYMWNTYYEDLVHSLLRQLTRLMGIVVLISWFPAILLARHLSKPLVKLEGAVKQISDRNWNQPISIDRKDEIGRLAASIEQMRIQLQRQDQYQQSMLQHISHELKTPVMVIRSYAQSIQDGIYPRGNLTGSLEVIDGEAARLEKRIRDLLYLTKLDFMATQKPNRQPIQFDLLVESVVERLRWRRPELTWSCGLQPLEGKGDPEQWTVAIENLLDNQIRYARSEIRVTLSEADGQQDGGSPAVILHIWNDGPPLEEETAQSLFQPFRKGTKGQFGLGLTIVSRIAELHEAKLEARNEEGGVGFRIRIPPV